MNQLVTDPGLRNWIKACLGLKYVRDGMLPYMQRKCEDVYANNETFTKTIAKLTTYSCSVCCVKDVKPNHSMNSCPAKGQLGGKTKCACTSKKKQLCPNGGACGVMYDRIMDDHVNMTPRWDNSDCQKWYLNGWEQMKCFIDIPGYKDKALISQADVTAFVHICQNNKTFYTIFKSHLGKLIQLEADVGIEVNTVTEIEARKEALSALIEDTRTLEDKSDLSIQQAKFAVLQDNHMRSIADRLKGIKEEFNLCAKVLLEQSSELKSITAGVHANTKAFEALQKELVQQSELIRGIEVTTVKTNIVVTKSYKTLKDVECDVKTILLIFKEILKYNRPHARNINGTIVAEIMGAANEKHLSNEIVQAIRSQISNPDQEANGDIDTVLMDVKKAVEADGDEMIDVRPGSIIIKILCQSMSNWINLCEKCIDGRMTQLFKSLQDHLRKSTSFGNLTITVDMLESDFIESVDTIVKQLYPYMIAALPHNMEMHRPDGIENTNVQHMNAMLKCLLEKSHQYSHQKPQMQIDNGQTTWVTVDQTCMETKTHQNETPPTSETLLVQNTFSGRHTDLNVKEDVKSTDLEACDRKIDIYSREDGPDKTKVQEENTALLLEIAQLCNRPDRKTPEVLFLLGATGVGKSAMVNTIIKALCGKYFPKAKTGHGLAATKTLTLQWFKHCGIEKFELQDLQNDAFRKCLDKLPTIIDAAGKGNENSAEFREILEMVFGGFIPPGTSVAFLQDQQAEQGVGCLKRLYTSPREEWKVTKVVFVACCTQALPTQLVECLNDVLKTYDRKTGLSKFDIDVFVAITKFDLVEEQSSFEIDSQEDKKITMKDFLAREREVATHFSIDGSLKHNSIRWVSYVDGHSEDNPFIENIALRFVRQMMQPGRSKHQEENEPSPVVTTRVEMARHAERWVNETNVDVKQVLIFLFVAIFIAFLYKILSKSV
ncbi:uncharacterized protein LOC127837564 isoform X2 [Dreissena polymorpha]|uniref:uncharacterized protein LOC127837564 isoform X2 n=1 Tax=Dreissena polymorpha TaxID=45954 RepID=UPI0022648E4B|nr:uncharacterized protein LOC127837564 isoform X2 [Dreissena polymorpha]